MKSTKKMAKIAKEGYCIMQYKCRDCGKIEKMYNSRNSVTPFIITCECGGKSQHINFQEDIFDPEYIPKPGQRVFFSMPIELAQIFARRNLELWQKSKSISLPPEEDIKEWKKIYENLVEEYYHNGEAPCIFTMPPIFPKEKE